MFSFLVLALYVVLNMWWDNDVNWGKVTAGVEFSYQQSWGSFAIGGFLIFLYIFQIYLKESSKPSKADPPTAQRAYEKLQICNDYATEYSITSYLLISMLLGMSRSVVLETEAQLLLMSALGLSLLTYLTVDVRSYFLYVEDCFRELMDSEQETFFDNRDDKQAERHDKHHTMMDGTFLLTQIICTPVAFVFFGIA